MWQYWPKHNCLADFYCHHMSYLFYFKQIHHSSSTFSIDVLYYVQLCIKKAPKYLMQLPHLTSTSFTFMLLVVHFCNCPLEPNRMNSVFELFIFNQFTSIQTLMSSKHDSSLCMVSSSISLSFHLALNLPLIPWSSAYLWMSIVGGITSAMVLAYNKNKIGLAQLPWGTLNSKLIGLEYALPMLT